MTTDSTWINKITPYIYETLSLSDQGTIPIFPMEQFVTAIKGSLALESLSIQVEKMDWIDHDFFYRGFGTKTIVIPLSMPPLSGELFFVMGMEDIKTLIKSMEKTDATTGTITLDNELIIKGLYTYLLTEVIDSIFQLQVYKDLSIKITDAKNDALESYAIELSINLQGSLLPARILIPTKFYKSIHSHFTFITPTLEHLEGMINVAIPLTICNGSATLPVEEVEKLEEGDFLIIKNSFYNLEEKKGSFQMLLGTIPLFQVKMQKDGIKVLDNLYFYNEEHMTYSDDDFTEDFSDDFSSDFLEDQDQEDQDQEDQDQEDQDQEEEEKIPSPEKVEELDVDQKIIHPEQTNVSQIAITVHLEVARFSLSLEEVKKLQSGFKLPVKINPEQVNLIVSGKSIGTGEMIKVGDVIGVKINKLYN